LLFDITAGKAIIFLTIFTICPNLTGRKVIVFFPFIPNEGNLAQAFYSFCWKTDNVDAFMSITDKCIKL